MSLVPTAKYGQLLLAVSVSIGEEDSFYRWVASFRSDRIDKDSLIVIAIGRYKEITDDDIIGIMIDIGLHLSCLDDMLSVKRNDDSLRLAPFRFDDAMR